RREAGKKIDPATAEVYWHYGEAFDPYGVGLDIRPEHQQTGREYFARSPGSDIWVNFAELPQETRDALWKVRHARSPGLLDFSSGYSAEERFELAAFYIVLAYAVAGHSSEIEVPTGIGVLSPERFSNLKNKLARLRDWLDAHQRRSDTPDAEQT